MSQDELAANLPSLHQKLAVLVLVVLGVSWIVRQVRYQRVREEHALLWFLGLAALTVVIFVDPLLLALTAALGIDVPASALLLLALFFLFIVSVWLTSVASLQKQQIAQLLIAVSILRSKLAESQDPADPEETDREPSGPALR
jgi:hypothetical protein